MTMPNTGKTEKKLDPPYIAGGDVKWYNIHPKKVFQFPKKLHTYLSYGPEILPLGIYPKEMKIYVVAKTCTHMFIGALFLIAKNWK